jgi:hypothetical protein
MKTSKFFLLGAALAIVGPLLAAAPTNPAGAPQLVSVKKIWAAGAHNAFTDLVRYDGKWFCTFRESEGHVGGDGTARVLVSRDGDTWESAALLTEAGIDLRDPKFAVTPDNRLMLVMGGSVYQGGKTLLGRQPRVAFSKDGRTWTAPERVMEPGDWLWRVTWHEGRAYGVTYVSSDRQQPPVQKTEWTVTLVVSDDGRNFRPVAKLAVPGRPNEATVRFQENGDCVVLVRREAADKMAWIGVSPAPYREWKWSPAGLQIGGPNFIVLPDGGMIAGGRQYNPAPTGARFFVGRMDLKAVTPQLVFPSGGDCSYPGLVWHEGMLWVSYYSSHEGKSSIYLAKVKY